MNPLPGFQLAPYGRLHVIGARHPLEQMASATAWRAASGALLLHALFFGSILLVQLLAGARPAVDLPELSVEQRKMVLEPPPSINPGPSGLDIGESAPMKRFTSEIAGIPEPVFDLEAEEPSIAPMDDIGLPFDPTDGGEVTGGRGGSGGPGKSLNDEAI